MPTPTEPTFCFFDWETQGPDLTVCGSLRYVLDPSTSPLLLSFCLVGTPVWLWIREGVIDTLVPEVAAFVRGRVDFVGGVPPLLESVATAPSGYFVAWNAAFDRHVWQQIAVPEYGFPDAPLEKFLDAMAQGQASNLPGTLDGAGRALNVGEKIVGGKSVMKRFADPVVPLPGTAGDLAGLEGATRQKRIQDAIEMWGLYLDYSQQDTGLLRDIWLCTRPLDAQEWAEYWTSERINDRGVPFDLDVCRGAVTYREEDAAYVEAECLRITDGAIEKPTLTQKINQWVFERLPEDLAQHMVKARDENGDDTNLTLGKQTVTRLLDEILQSDAPPADNVVEFLELLQFGRASSSIKYQKVLDQEVDCRLTNTYVFNGAGQTGRYSNRGVQLHNLPRDFFSNEATVVDMIADQVPIEVLREIGPVSQTLSKCLRPSIVAPEGKTFVWGDWSAIEARVDPWLANSRGAERAVLDPFREGRDLYVMNAEAIFDIPEIELIARLEDKDSEAKNMRQAAKVAVLALGFLGGVGAYKAMARGYGMIVSDEEALRIVQGWRAANRWARIFGDKCEEAAFSAIGSPGTLYGAGRLNYVYVPELLGGTLVCYLPDQRPILYPSAVIKKVEKFDKMVDTITYMNRGGRRPLWNGLQIENATQGLAASILRGTLTRLEDRHPDDPVVLHTHDECLCEVDDDPQHVASFQTTLESVMVEGFDWSAGLPLAAEVTSNWYYTKNAG